MFSNNDISKREFFVIHLLDVKNAVKTTVSSFPTRNDIPLSIFEVFLMQSLYLKYAICQTWLYLEKILQIPGHCAIISMKTLSVCLKAHSQV